MAFWFLIWIFLAVFVFGMFFWSLNILFRQKRAWTSFANKNSLRVEPGPLLASAAVKGFVKGFDVTLYSEEQSADSGRGRRFRTVIQIDLAKPMATGGVVASPDMKVFVNSLNLPNTFEPDLEGWNKNIVIAVQDADKIKPYFTPDRLRSLNGLMSMKVYNVIFIFDLQNSYLRLETPDPLSDEVKLDKLVQKLVEQAKILQP